MSIHPNVILMAVLKPDGLSRKTFRDIIENSGGDAESEDHEIKINNQIYHVMVMEEDYSEGYQISAKEGDIVVYDLVTYGYGEKIEWSELALQQAALRGWAEAQCAKFSCSLKIYVSANYW